MKFIHSLTPDQRATLSTGNVINGQRCSRCTSTGRRNGPTHRVRQRAQAILLSARGYKIDQLADIFECDRDTISQWLDLFCTQGLHSGFSRSERRAQVGTPAHVRCHVRCLDAAAQQVVQQAAQQAAQHPTPNLKATVLATLKKRAVPELGHAQTLPQTQRLHLPPCPPGAAQSAPARCTSGCTSAAVQRALAKLHRLEAAGCAVTCCMATCCMATRAAFRCCLVFPICGSPKALWQPKGQTLCLPAHPHQKRLNILGFWN